MNKNPEKRMKIKEVLEHPWLKKYTTKTESTHSLNKVMSGGQEFKIYSSLSLEPKTSEFNMNVNDNQGSSNTLGLPLASMNLPIYTNKNPNMK